jgi:hypothetical protein
MGDETANPAQLPSPEELTAMSMKMMSRLTAELHHLNEQLTLNRDLMKDVRDTLVGNVNVSEELGKVLVRLVDVAESVDDVLDIHAAAMEALKDGTAGQSRITFTDYARAFWEAADQEGDDDPGASS